MVGGRACELDIGALHGVGSKSTKLRTRSSSSFLSRHMNKRMSKGGAKDCQLSWMSWRPPGVWLKMGRMRIRQQTRCQSGQSILAIAAEVSDQFLDQICYLLGH